jgi:hypothetical protein
MPTPTGFTVLLGFLLMICNAISIGESGRWLPLADQMLGRRQPLHSLWRIETIHINNMNRWGKKK